MATVLKSGDRDKQRAAALSAVAGFNLSDLADEGRTRLEQCRLQVQKCLLKRNVRWQESKSLGAAVDEGLKQAAIDADTKLQEKAEQQASHSTSVMQEAVRKIRDAHAEWMKDYDILIKMSLAAVEKIIRHGLEAEPELMVKWAEEALLSTRTAVSLTLVIHPETLAKAGEGFEKMVMTPGLPEKTRIETDEKIARDEVIVRQTGGEIQAGLTAQLDRLEELLQ